MCGFSKAMGFEALYRHLLHDNRESLPYDVACDLVKAVVLGYGCLVADRSKIQLSHACVAALLTRAYAEPHLAYRRSQIILRDYRQCIADIRGPGYLGHKGFLQWEPVHDRDVQVELESFERALHSTVSKPRNLLRFRRAHEAHRDARLVFRAAAEGRPLELQKRLQLGRLAGGYSAEGVVKGTSMVPLEAARAGKHHECVTVLNDMHV